MSKAWTSGLAWAALGAALAAGTALGREFDVQTLTDTNALCRNPALSDSGLAAWTQVAGVNGETVDLRSDLWVCEPGGTPLAEEIREVVKGHHRGEAVHPVTELLLERRQDRHRQSHREERGRSGRQGSRSAVCKRPRRHAGQACEGTQGLWQNR